jgi:molybdopterin molybdotransferase
MIHPDKAEEILNNVKTITKTEVIPVSDSFGRVLAEDIYSALDSPPFDKSAMDGYAFNSKDTGNKLKVIAVIGAGEAHSIVLKAGECAKIMTGAMVPEGADSVVKVENTTEENGMMSFDPEKVKNIIYKGENLKTGDKVIEKCIIRPQEIGVLSSLGMDKVEVAKQPLVGVITTGTEIREPGETLEVGQIYNSNGHQIKSQIEAMHCRAKYFGTVPDDMKKTFKIIKNAIDECDVVILSGGVSMGDFDFVPKMLEENGVNILIRKVAVKPGKPTLFGEKNGKFVFGLPGNPVSTFIIFEIFIKSFLYKIMGIKYVPNMCKGILQNDVKRKRTERVAYKPVVLSNGKVTPVLYHGSSHLNVLSVSNALLVIPQGVPILKKGTEVDVRQV